MLHIIAPVSFGGGESLLYNLLKNSPIEEDVVLLYNSKEFISKLESQNIKYYLLNKKSIGHFQSRMKYLFDFIKNIFLVLKINKIVKSNNCSHVHLHGFPAIFYGVIIKKINKKVKVIYTHHSYRQKPKNYLEYFIFKYIYLNVDTITAVSGVVKKSLENAFNIEKNKIHIIYNCISDEFFYKQINKPNEIHQNNKIKFIQVARLVKGKNHQLVIESLGKIEKRFLENIEIYFLGDGPERNILEDIVKKYNLEGVVVFLGAKYYDEVPSFIQSCNIGLFPSEFEGFGLGAAECMACGLPILALNNSIMREIVADNGILTDKKSFSESLIKITQDSFLNEKIKEYAKRFSINNIKKEYIKLYESLK